MTGAPGVIDPQTLLLGLMDPGNRADPYPLYERFLDAGPLALPDANLVGRAFFVWMNFGNLKRIGGFE